MTMADNSNNADIEARNGATAIIYVCTTCRQPDDPDDAPRPGAALAAATARAAENTDITVQPLRCLANCKRGCSAVMRRTDASAPAWTYVFGHLDPAADAQALVQGAQLLAQSADGLMPWRDRPCGVRPGAPRARYRPLAGKRR